ncbi:MAG: Ig-like domain-containing protein [Methanobacterium paludis]|nr:Ig-like domain-containing protein [Methanobacterium paludis]
MLLLLALSVNCTYANVDSNDTVANLTNTTAIPVLTDNSTLNGTNTSNNTSTTTNNSVNNGDTDNVLKTNSTNEGNTTNANTKNTTSTNTGNITNTVTNQVNSENSVNLITVTAVDPVNKAVNVAVDEVIKVTFSKAIKAGTSWFELKSSNGTIVSVTPSISGNVLTITPANALIKGTKYALILHTGSVTDLAGNNLAYYGTNFVTTTDGVAPNVKSVDPVNKAVNVAVDKVIKVTFSEAIKVGTGWFELKSSNGTIVSVTSSINGNVLTITPVNALIKGTKYALILHTGSVTDLAGNNLAYYG